jgi:hypothetical protein
VRLPREYAVNPRPCVHGSCAPRVSVAVTFRARRLAAHMAIPLEWQGRSNNPNLVDTKQLLVICDSSRSRVGGAEMNIVWSQPRAYSLSKPDADRGAQEFKNRI